MRCFPNGRAAAAVACLALILSVGARAHAAPGDKLDRSRFAAWEWNIKSAKGLRRTLAWGGSYETGTGEDQEYLDPSKGCKIPDVVNDIVYKGATLGFTITLRPITDAERTLCPKTFPASRKFVSGYVDTGLQHMDGDGVYEARFSVPNVAGAFPAWWFQPAKPGTPERDGSEYTQGYQVQWKQDRTNQSRCTFHPGPAYTPNDPSCGVAKGVSPNVFHTYDLVRDHGTLALYIDDVEIGETYGDAPGPIYMILNLAHLPGYLTSTLAPNNPPATMNVDHMAFAPLKGAN